MKRFNNILIFGLMVLLFTACTNRPEELRNIPENSTFVMTFLPQQLQEKSGVNNFSETNIYSSIIENKNKEDLSGFLEFDYIFQDMNESGINLSQNMFLFFTESHNGHHERMGINFGIENHEKFTNSIEKLVKTHGDSIEIVEEDGVKYLVSTKVNAKEVLAWNNTTAIALIKTKGNTNMQLMKTRALELLDQSLSKSIASNGDFLDFYESRQDFNIWLSSSFMLNKIPKDYKLIAQMQLPFNFDGINYHYFMSFDNGEASIKSELVLPKELENLLEGYEIIKKDFDEKMLQYVPKNSLANISFAINPYEFYRMTKDLYAERQIDTDAAEDLIEASMNIDIENILKAFKGECIINIHDVKLIHKPSCKSDAEENDSLSLNNERMILSPQWMYSVLLKLDDEDVYNWLLDKFSDNKNLMSDNYYKINDNPNNELFVAMVDNYLMLTNDQKLIKGFVKGKKQKQSLADSDIAKHLREYSLYAKVNMDYSTYPEDIQVYFDSLYSTSDKMEMRNKLSEIRYEPKDSYSAKLIMEFKNKEENSLKQLIN